MVVLDLKITMHFHYVGKFEERDKKLHYVRETGCASIEYDCDRLSLPELNSILKDDCKSIDELIEGLALPLVISNFVDEKCAITHTKEAIEPILPEKCAITHSLSLILLMNY